MLSIYELVTLEFQNEHDLEHNTKFSTPKIFDAKGDLSKRWYVYFSYRNPETGRLQRMKNIYGKVNRFKTKESRYSALNLYKKRLLKFLDDGYNPFEDNTELHKKKLNDVAESATTLQSKLKTEMFSTVLKPQEDMDSSLKRQTLTVEKAFEKALELKKNIVNKKTLDDYRSRINQLKKWLNDNYKTTIYCNQITKKMVVEFLNTVQLTTSARNRNNYRTVFSSLFQILEDNDIIEKNFIKPIKLLKTQPKRNKTYSVKEQTDIFNYLEANDPLLLIYIKFISYNLLRPKEVCRLRVKDINIEQLTLQFQAKNKVLKTKIIPQILFDELPDLSKMPNDYLLFTPDKLGGFWSAELDSRRDYFSRRFKKVVKDHFGYNENYGLYSFRHTFITKLYKALVKDSSPHEAKSKLMLITGHSTMSALEKYLRDIDAELPDDYSSLL